VAGLEADFQPDVHISNCLSLLTRDVIHSLSFSFDGSLLVSGSQDGDCMVWDVSSRQSLRKFSQHKGPITSVSCFIKPPELTGAFVGQQRSTEPVMPITPFKRARRTEDEEREHGLIMIVPNRSQVKTKASYNRLFIVC
jgi:pre-rRNA-processing protein IPI3